MSPRPAFDALQISALDNTATLLKSVRISDEVVVGGQTDVLRIKALDDTPFGHKISIRDIHSSDSIVKYGEVIGTASRDIPAGSHVHVQNVESNRGRGDMAEQNAPASQLESCEEVFTPKVPDRPIINARSLCYRGYSRPDGSVGIRNLVGIISCVACANDVVVHLSDIEGVACFTHQQGCSQTKPDLALIAKVLTNLAKNPNLGAILYVSLGCESVPTEEIVRQAKTFGKPVEFLIIQKEGGLTQTVEHAKAVVADLKQKIAAAPTEHPFNTLKLGLKCGSSDTTQGLSANVIAGKITDIFTAAGASVVIGETTEFMGAEHIAARRCVTSAVAQEIAKRVSEMEARAKAVGVDMRGGQPTRGNIEGGLTTIEEKSLGALAKAGSSIFQRVIDYGDNVRQPGLVMMDSPGREPEMLTGLAAAGCNLILFTTGRGAPQGFPFVPVVKTTGNENTWQCLQEHIDCYVGKIMRGEESYADATQRLFDEIMLFINGDLTKAEQCRYNNSMNIYVTGPTI